MEDTNVNPIAPSDETNSAVEATEEVEATNEEVTPEEPTPEAATDEEVVATETPAEDAEEPMAA